MRLRRRRAPAAPPPAAPVDVDPERCCCAAPGPSVEVTVDWSGLGEPEVVRRLCPTCLLVAQDGIETAPLPTHPEERLRALVGALDDASAAWRQGEGHYVLSTAQHRHYRALVAEAQATRLVVQQWRETLGCAHLDVDVDVEEITDAGGRLVRSIQVRSCRSCGEIIPGVASQR